MRKTLVLTCLLFLITVGYGGVRQHTSQATQLKTITARAQKPLYERTKPNSLPSVDSVNPTTVEIIRQKHDQLKAMDVTITNIATVWQLYSNLRVLRLFPSGTMHCPMDTGVIYTLIFKSGEKLVLIAQADPTGCKTIKLSTGQTLWGVDQEGKPFWILLARLVGLPNDNYLGGMQPSS